MSIKANVVSSEIYEQNKRTTFYRVVVSYDNLNWSILRRYNEFSKLVDAIKREHPNISLKLPKKKFFGNNFSADFIKNRRSGLNDLVQKILVHPELLNLVDVREFFVLDNNFRNSLEGSDENEAEHGDHLATITSNHSDKLINLGPSEKNAKPGDFEFLRTIGKGSFGKVYLARHIRENKDYAIKVLNKKMIIKRNEKNHIMSERNVLLKNLNHPFLIGLHYSFQTKDKLYFVLDFVNGGELFFHLTKERYFNETRARFYVAEITCALSYLHSQGIIYRDLKPENILFDSDGHVVLTDFGLCKEGLKEKDTTNTFCGTPEYLAPEVLRKEAYDRCVDWWCLGAVLYEMLNSFPPFYSRDHTEMCDNILHRPLKYIRNGISPPAKSLIEGLLQKDRRRRLGSVNDAEDIKRHEFFNSIDWEALEQKRIPPPFNPNVSNSTDLRNIDPEFVRESVPGSVITPHMMESYSDNPFQGFSYTNPSTMLTAEE